MRTTTAQGYPLSAPLTVTDTRSGFAGETGAVWTIAPDCSFTVARQIGLKILAPHKQGRLTAEQQARLRNLLDRLTAAGLPTQLGAQSQVNQRRIVVTYAGTTSVLTLAPRASRRPRSTGDPTDALLDLADALKTMTAG